MNPTKCNRSICQNPAAPLWHRHLAKAYCPKCAALINNSNRHDPITEGIPLIVPVAQIALAWCRLTNSLLGLNSTLNENTTKSINAWITAQGLDRKEIASSPEAQTPPTAEDWILMKARLYA